MRMTSLILVISLFSGCCEATAVQAEDVLLHDFARGYAPWRVSGKAFGTEPAEGNIGSQRGVRLYRGQRLINSYGQGDKATGRLLSPSFVIRRNYIECLVGGGCHPRQACVNLRVAGEVVQPAK